MNANEVAIVDMEFLPEELTPRANPKQDCLNAASNAKEAYTYLDRPSYLCKRVILAMVQFEATHSVLYDLYQKLFSQGGLRGLPNDFRRDTARDETQILTPLAATFEAGVAFIVGFKGYILQVDDNSNTKVSFDYAPERERRQFVERFETKVKSIVMRWKANLKSWLAVANMSDTLAYERERRQKSTIVLSLKAPRVKIPRFTKDLIDCLLKNIDEFQGAYDRLRYAWHAIRDANDAMNMPALSLLLQLVARKAQGCKMPIDQEFTGDQPTYVSASDPFGPFTIRELRDDQIQKIRFLGIKFVNRNEEDVKNFDPSFEIDCDGGLSLRGKLSSEVIIQDIYGLDQKTREQWKMPNDAYSFRYMYPTVAKWKLSDPPAEPMEFLKCYGGFVFFGIPPPEKTFPQRQRVLTVVGMVSTHIFDEEMHYADYFEERATVFTDMFLWPSLKIPKSELGIDRERFQWINYRALENPHSFTFTLPGELGIANFGGFLLDYGPGTPDQVCYNIISHEEGMNLLNIRQALSTPRGYFTPAVCSQLQTALYRILTIQEPVP